MAFQEQEDETRTNRQYLVGRNEHWLPQSQTWPHGRFLEVTDLVREAKETTEATRQVTEAAGMKDKRNEHYYNGHQSYTEKTAEAVRANCDFSERTPPISRRRLVEKSPLPRPSPPVAVIRFSPSSSPPCQVQPLSSGISVPRKVLVDTVPESVSPYCPVCLASSPGNTRRTGCPVK